MQSVHTMLDFLKCKVLVPFKILTLTSYTSISPIRSIKGKIRNLRKKNEKKSYKVKAYKIFK